MSDEKKLLAPIEGAPDPNAPFVTVKCSNPGCRLSFFVSKQHPALPDGPFFCDDHSDVRTRAKQSDCVVLAVICDDCSAQLVVEAKTRAEARDELRAAIKLQNWLVVDRLEGAIETAADLTGRASSTMIGAKDLCGECRKKL